MHMKRTLALLLACLLLCPMLFTGALAAGDEAEPGYVIDGAATEDGYTLDIRAKGLFAYTGRLALAFDAEKLSLSGPDDLSAFQMAPGLTAVAELRPESEMVSSAGGYAALAWYCSGLDATAEPKSVATLAFRFREGYSAADIDAATFRLMAVEAGDLGPFAAAASFQGRGSLAPISYEYLTDKAACGVDFVYAGSDRPPAAGHALSFRFRNNLDELLPGTLEVNGRSYSADAEGNVTVRLGAGEYLWRARSDGYGVLTGRITLTEAQSVELCFLSDETLVRQAANTLTIGYQPGDSARHVSNTLQLPRAAEGGVEVAWQSSQPNTVTREGLVYLPESQGVELTLTATLTRGKASETRSFALYVCSRSELQSGGQGEIPAPAFQDLAGYAWAKSAIEKLAAAGIIRGTSDTTFSPGANIRRGDFVALLMRMLGAAGKATVAFDDVPEDSYYFQEIAQARALGIAQGTGDNLFRPKDPITRQDMITLTMRALAKTGYLPAADARDDLSAFQDRDDISGYARDSLEDAVARGLIAGSAGKLNPRNYTTRAETAVFMERIYSAHNS